MEEWKPVVGYEGLYEVSNQGNVRSLPRIVEKSNGVKTTVKGKVMTKRLNDRGYHEIKLSVGGKGAYKKLHRIVAMAFIPNPENKEEVNHKDTDKLNNTVDNLEWNTHEENIRHAFANNLIDRKGEKGSNSKLTDDDVREIRKRKANGEHITEVHKLFADKVTINGFKPAWYGYYWTHIK
ncbi:HNH endonuclease [Bacillus phage W.Ph.]|uniref:Gp257 n=1 Tax=Bacillus phage W.Ph. TaxID=764595 RepID=G9B208_9CAUD|nr:HNH endonuclease [Bacillus phage W.Ph.]ADH03403.1 gp257 [Bacillus phage W.Ph.]